MALDLAVVPAAGHGTRLLPLTKAVPKELLPVGDRPLAEWVLRELTAAGIARVVLVTSAAKRAIEDHISGDGPAVASVRQPVPRGLGDAVLCAQGFTGDGPFVVALGDSLITGGDVVARLRETVAHGYDGALAVERVPREQTGRYGIVDVDRHGAVRALIEKPAPAEAPSELAICARYVLPEAIFGALRDTPPGHGGELQLTDAIARLIAGGARFAAVPLPDGARRLDLGTPYGYGAAVLERLLADPDLRAHARALLGRDE